MPDPAAIRQNLQQLEIELEAQERLAELKERHGAAPASRLSSQADPLTPKQVRLMWDESTIVGQGMSGLACRRLVLPDGAVYVLLEYGD